MWDFCAGVWGWRPLGSQRFEDLESGPLRVLGLRHLVLKRLGTLWGPWSSIPAYLSHRPAPCGTRRVS